MLQPDDDRTFSGESSYWPAAANFHLCTRSRGPLTILRPGDDTIFYVDSGEVKYYKGYCIDTVDRD